MAVGYLRGLFKVKNYYVNKWLEIFRPNFLFFIFGNNAFGFICWFLWDFNWFITVFLATDDSSGYFRRVSKSFYNFRKTLVDVTLKFWVYFMEILHYKFMVKTVFQNTLSTHGFHLHLVQGVLYKMSLNFGIFFLQDYLTKWRHESIMFRLAVWKWMISQYV